MELGMSNSLLAGDPRLIDHIVGEVKSQGIFDQFRKECIADVDTKPAYQNLRTRVEGSVNSFLNKQTWRTDLNKNQLRETLRKHIHDAPYLEVGVERIVDQVVNPKIYSVFMPQIEDVVYKFLGIERPKPQRNGACDLKDLLPKDLDPVSPESDRNSLKDISLESIEDNVREIVNGDEQKPCSSSIDEKADNTACTPIKKEVNIVQNGESSQVVISSPMKAVLNSSFKSDETNKTEEDEEDSPVFEPIDIMNLNESNMSNDSHMSGISELTSHRSQSPDFMTEFSRDNFDCSNQDSQLSKVSSNSRLSIVTDFGSSNHASTPLPESKEDSKNTKDNFKDVGELDSNKESKFNFEVIKSKDNSKLSNSSKENSRDASEYKDSKIKEDFNSKSRYSKDKYDSRSSRDKDRDSRRRHSNKSSKYSRSKSKDKNELESQENKEYLNKYKESKAKENEKKGDSFKEVKDLKDLYKEKIRELREKKELTEKEKLGKDKDSVKVNKDSKDKKDSSSSREKDDYRRSHKSSSSSSRNLSYHNNKTSRNSESKDSRDKSSSRRDDRRHTNGKGEYKSSTRSKRDSKSESKSDSRSSDRSLKDKKRRDEKKSKSTDDHSSLRKNSNDRRSTDRDGSNGSSSKYSHKSSYGANNSSGKLGPSANLTKDNNKNHHSTSETSDSVHDSLQMMFRGGEHAKGSSSYNSTDNPPKRVDPGAAEICLPLKKRPLHSDESASENQTKKPKTEDKKASKRKIEKDIFKFDTDVTSVPDEERVQIIEIPDEEYDQPYPDKKPILSLEETKKIILDAESIHSTQSKLSEMEQSIRQSLNEMMSDNKFIETEDAFIVRKTSPIMDSTTLLETLTDDSNNDLESTLMRDGNNIVTSQNTEKIEEKSEDDVRKDEEVTEKNIKKIEEIKEETIKQDENMLENNIRENESKEEDIKIVEQETDEYIKENVDIINKDVKAELDEADGNIQSYIETTNEDFNKIKEKVGEDVIERADKYVTDDAEETEEDIKKYIESTEGDLREGIQIVEQNTEEDLKLITVDEKPFMKNREKDINDGKEKIDLKVEGAIDGKEQNNDEKEAEMDTNELSKTDEHNNHNHIKKAKESIKVNAEMIMSDIKESADKAEQDIDVDVKKIDTKASEIIESIKNTEQNINADGSKIEVNNKEFVEKVHKAVNDYVFKTEVNVERSVENLNDNIDQDEESTDDNTDEFNEDDKLVIDEEFDEKENDDYEIQIESKECATNNERQLENVIDCRTSNENEELKQFNENKKDNEKEVELKECVEEKSIDDEIIIPNDDQKPSKIHKNDDDYKKPVGFMEDEIQEQITHQLIDELGKLNEDDSDNEKLNEDDSDNEKQNEEDELIETPNENDINNEKSAIEDETEKSLKQDKNSDKSSEHSNSVEEETKSEKHNDDCKKIVESKENNDDFNEDDDDDDDDDEDKRSELIIICEEKEEAEEELTLIFNEDSKDTDEMGSSPKLEETNIDINIPLFQEEDEGQDVSVDKLSNDTITFGETCGKIFKINQTLVVTSPVEDECLYLKSDNQKYLSFKKYLEKLEADPSRSLEEMIESYGGMVVPAVQMVTPIVLSVPKRKLSPSPVADILITNSNNNNDGLVKEATVEEVSEDVASVAKKRKVGRMKKTSSTGASVVSAQPPPQQQQLQQQQQPQPQPQQVAMINGENFVMPLSPESDVSATSEKNPAHTLRDDRSRHRSSQRYSSDDLYKPRPLFSSSSRRNRRFHQA